MKIAYLDCVSGISGDMTLGALVDAGVDLEAIERGVQSLGLEGCRLVRSEVKRHGFRATKITVEHPPEHAHRHLHHITDMIDRSQLTAPQKALATKIFTRLGEAEAKVHGTTVRKVHFHEVGAVDSIADVVGAAIGWDLLGADAIHCSPIPTGGGTIEIAHGRVNVPAPATAELLVGIPLAESPVVSELTTPTGAAIAATCATAFGPLPPMRITAIGYGAGDRDFTEQANVLRLIVGESDDAGVQREQLAMVETNLDDATGEVIAHATARLMEAGALDVYTTAVQMKKNRPAVVISALARMEDAERLEAILFRETTTLGVRRWTVARRSLDRRPHRVETSWGPIAGKLAVLPDGSRRFSPENDDCRRVAAEHGLPLLEVERAARAAFDLSASSGD